MRTAFATLAAVVTLASASAAIADDRVTKLNQDVIGLLGSDSRALDTAIAIARAVDHRDGLRILPIAGRGPVQSLTDILYLRGIDAAVIPSDVSAFARQNDLLSDTDGKLAYLAKLGTLDILLIAGAPIATKEDLAGKRIATGATDSSAYVAADLIFGGAGIGYENVAREGGDAIAAVAAGQADAALLVGPRPNIHARLINGQSGLHLVPLELTETLETTYAPSILTADDYPSLIAQGDTVETVSSSLILAVFNWPANSESYYRIRKFTAAIFDTLEREGGEAGLNISASAIGWQRYVTAEDWLRNRKKRSGLAATMTSQGEN